MTPLTTQIFEFHWVKSVLMTTTPTPAPTPWLVKPAFKDALHVAIVACHPWKAAMVKSYPY